MRAERKTRTSYSFAARGISKNRADSLDNYDSKYPFTSSSEAIRRSVALESVGPES